MAYDKAGHDVRFFVRITTLFWKKKMHQGWICPRCGKCWAPWVVSCKCSTPLPLDGTVTIYPLRYVPYPIPSTADLNPSNRPPSVWY